MTVRRRAQRGFTLIEVLAAVLIFGLVFTMLARVALVGLRSEGLDRRRAEAALVADRELALLETLVAIEPLEVGVTTNEADPYLITIEVKPEDVMAMLPAVLRDEIRRDDDSELETMLVDERGESRVQRLTVVVEWDEAGEPAQLARTTFVLDTSDLAELFPAEADAGTGTGDDTDEGEESSLGDQLGGNVPVELQQLLRQAEGSQ
jgi:prepilin-type N-terminal cleavage/methylation domain-containing protein